MYSRPWRKEFKEFFDRDVPPYAILSHRWGEDEVSFRDFLEKRDGKGFEKIMKFCKQALPRMPGWASGNEITWV
jgi:hypothetical protein